jgi:hypothetical protein
MKCVVVKQRIFEQRSKTENSEKWKICQRSKSLEKRCHLGADVSTITPVADTDDPKRLKLALNDGLPPERITSNNVDFVLILGEASYALVTQPSYASSSSTRP